MLMKKIRLYVNVCSNNFCLAFRQVFARKQIFFYVKHIGVRQWFAIMCRCIYVRMLLQIFVGRSRGITAIL